jgi:hypothetical protein
MKILNKISQNQFNLRVNIAKSGLFNLDKYDVIKEIKPTNSFFAKQPIIANADPFMFVDKNILYLFYEEQNILNNGIIKMIKTNDLKKWSKPKTVLEEKFHLSFPFVFKDNSQVYMMPESGNDNSIKLYKPNYNFTSWTYYKTLLSGNKFVDSSIIFKDNLYFLFTSIMENDKYKFLIYSSDSLVGKWKRNSSTPIVNNIINSRCGGSVFKYKNEYFRPTQLTNSKYGEGLIINKVLCLNKTNYIEDYYLKLIPNASNFYKLGGHHFNYCKFLGYEIVATDALSLNFNFFEISRRIANKIK